MRALSAQRPAGGGHSPLDTLKLAAILSLAVAVAYLPSQAPASFPGRNGKIAFNRGALVPSEIDAMNPSGSGRRRLVQGGSASVGGAVWSADGSAIAYTRLLSASFETGSFKAAIYTAKADGSGRRRITPIGTFSDPSWSPDAKRIAFRRGARGSIYVMNSDGRGQTRLTRGHDLVPDWSPDGARILFVRDQALYVMNADGSGQARLAPRSVAVSSADWSPDAAKVAFAASGGIYTANADGSGRKRVRGTKELDLMPVWSPDGRQIAFTRTSLSLRTNIYVVGAGGGTPRGLTRDGKSTATDWQALVAGRG